MIRSGHLDNIFILKSTDLGPKGHQQNPFTVVHTVMTE